jgi:hypothetical protein
MMEEERRRGGICEKKMRKCENGVRILKVLLSSSVIVTRDVVDR